MNKEFINLLNNLEGESYMYCFLTYLLSPVITGVKPSSTITLKKELKDIYNTWNKNGEKFLNQLNLKQLVLREYPDYKIVLIYNEKNLKKIVYNKTNTKFLQQLGYSSNMPLDETLLYLKNRYNTIHCPHELGIFLGIPLPDVEAFMHCNNKKCLMCGYWKVYKDAENAQKTFNSYDKSKKLIMHYILSGVKFNEIVLILKSFHKTITA